MHDFLRTEWKPELNRLDHTRLDPAYYMLDTQHWKDIFEMRNAKYSNWLEYIKMHPLSSLSVNYENLVSDSIRFLKQLTEEYDMPCKPVDEWNPITCHAKYGKCLGEVDFHSTSNNEPTWLPHQGGRGEPKPHPYRKVSREDTPPYRDVFREDNPPYREIFRDQLPPVDIFIPPHEDKHVKEEYVEEEYSWDQKDWEYLLTSCQLFVRN